MASPDRSPICDDAARPAGGDRRPAVAALPPADDAEVGQRGRFGGAVAVRRAAWRAGCGWSRRRRSGRRFPGSGTRCRPAGWREPGQPPAAACVLTATRTARSASSQARAAAGSRVRPAPGRAARRAGDARPADAVRPGPGCPWRGRGRQVVVEQAGQRGMPLALGVPGGREASRRRRAAGRACRSGPGGPVDQVRAGQQGEDVAGLGGRALRSARRRRRRQGRARDAGRSAGTPAPPPAGRCR